MFVLFVTYKDNLSTQIVGRRSIVDKASASPRDNPVEATIYKCSFDRNKVPIGANL